ncbi:MAG: pyruvate ferredoxin oxidoreductase, partial [Gammaproteobacteria bacterium]|nr:pyruvate ferredoxin oxidoreductase [Gammaproteobacteria bacterium]
GYERKDSGVETVLDGNGAVAITEAGISEVAAHGGTFPADGADLAWNVEESRQVTNVFHGSLATQGAESARGALASAIGLAMSGTRTTAFLSSPDLATVQDLLTMAAGRHLPLVLHLSNRALSTGSGALGSGHEAFHLSTDSGFFTLFAANVQEAVDFTLIARRVTELTLIPALVVMDGEQTALSVQEVKLPSPELIQEFLGPVDEEIPVLSPGQKLLFGETRRRVPRWHDLDRPVLQGALLGRDGFALGNAATQPFFGRQLTSALEGSLALFSKHTGRNYADLSTHNLEKAQLVLVAQGAAIETAAAVADHLRNQEKIAVGVLGIHGARPFPGAGAIEHLRGKSAVAVLERVDSPLAGDPPLMRELRASLDRAGENAKFGSGTHPDYPSVPAAEHPRLVSTIYGLGGAPLRAADLALLISELKRPGRQRLYLGMDFLHASTRYPKQQVLFGALRRSYPELARLGLRNPDPSPDVRPPGSLTVAVHRTSGQGCEQLAV